MDSLITLLLFGLFIVLLLPAILALNSNSKINQLKKEIDLLKKYIIDLHKGFESIKNLPVASKEVRPEKEKPVIIQTVKPQEIIKEEITEPPVPEVVIPVPEEKPAPVIETVEPKEEKIIIPQPVSVSPPPKPLTPLKPKKKTNFEQFIGEKLISLVGIAILVLGIFFTVKWAIDRNMITDAGKILIGFAAATILIGVAHKLSKNYRAFSSILAGGGIAVLYFSVYQAYQSYHLLPQAAAFIAMIVITILAVLLSLVYNKKELAVIALIGGFCTPFFVSNGSGNYQVLFSYLLILNIGMFAVANFKKWNLLNIIGYIFTVLIFSIWVYNSYDVTKGHNSGGLLFATLFYIVFFATNIIYNIRQQQKFAATEISMLLSNSFLYLGAGLFFLHTIHNGYYQGIFVIALAVFNFAFAYFFFRKQQIDKNLIYLLIALVLTFISLAGPVQLNGNYITLFWATEAVILYWLSVKSKIHIIKNASVVIVILTLVSLGIDWQNNYFSAQVNKLPVLLNKAFITGSVVIAALLVNLRWVRKDEEKALFWGALPVAFYTRLLEAATVLVIYMVGFRELYYQSFVITRLYDFRDMILWAYQYVFVAVLLWFVINKRTFSEQKIVAVIAALFLLAYPLADHSIFNLRTACLQHNGINTYFHLHYLIPIFALGILILLIQFLVKNFKVPDMVYKWGPWFLTVAGLHILSTEIIHIWVLSAYRPGFHWAESSRKASKVALPILWSIVSLALMWLGMKKRVKQLRIISLSLFTLTILKLFIYDISNVGQGGKIAAFIILGVILLIVSFMYQKIKDLFVDEKAADENLEKE